VGPTLKNFFALNGYDKQDPVRTTRRKIMLPAGAIIRTVSMLFSDRGDFFVFLFLNFFFSLFSKQNRIDVPAKEFTAIGSLSIRSLRVEFLLKTESGYLRDAEVT